MSLLVNVYGRDDQGRMEFHDGLPGSDLAGHEGLRNDLYGSACVISLGAPLLSRLYDGDLYLETPDELDQLERECGLVLVDLRRVTAATGLDPEYVAQRIGNIEAAAARARQIGGHVVVW